MRIGPEMKACRNCKHFTGKARDGYRMCDIREFPGFITLTKDTGCCSNFERRVKNERNERKQ